MPLAGSISRGSDFKGVYSLHRKLMLFQPNKLMKTRALKYHLYLTLWTLTLAHNAAKLREDAQLIEEFTAFQQGRVP